MKKNRLWVGGALLLGALLGRAIATGEVRSPGRSRDACAKNLGDLGTAIEMYTRDNRGLWPHGDAPQYPRFQPDPGLLTPNYRKSIPTCPAAGADTCSRRYCCTRDRCGYTVLCKGRFHEDSGPAPDFPQYTSTRGHLLAAIYVFCGAGVDGPGPH